MVGFSPRPDSALRCRPCVKRPEDSIGPSEPDFGPRSVAPSPDRPTMKGRCAPGDTCPAAPSIAPRGSSGVTARLGGGPRPDPVVRLRLIVSRVWVSFCVVSPPSPTPTPSSDAGGGHLRESSHRCSGGLGPRGLPVGRRGGPRPAGPGGPAPGSLGFAPHRPRPARGHRGPSSPVFLSQSLARGARLGSE